MDETSAIAQFISSIPSELPFGGIVALGIVALLRGWLLPRSHLVDLRKDFQGQLAAKDAEIERIVADRDARLLEVREDRDKRTNELREEVRDWREAHQASEAALAVVRAQNGELLEVARTSEQVLRAAFPAATQSKVGENSAG